MGHGNGHCSAPINTDDVSTVIGVASHDVATLCISGKVNKFNKDKPYRGTQPEVKSRTVDNATNETGKYLGSRGSGTTTGYPCFWGMRYPMNNATQNPSGSAKNNLLEICYFVGVRQGFTTNYQNYTYQKPVVGTDFCRLDDFVGYYHNNAAFLDAGVSGAEPGSSAVAKLSMNKFDNSVLGIYAIIPSNSVGWQFKDIIAEPDRYYLVAEFYKWEQWDETTAKSSTAAPFHVAWLNTAAGSLNNTNMSIYFEVPLSTIFSKGNFGSLSFINFYVCVGFNKRNQANTAWESGQGFVAPWVGNALRCATKVTVSTDSPYIVNFLKWAWVGSDTYSDFPTTAINSSNASMKFQATITNNGQNALNIYGLGSTPSNGLLFRARAFGSYGAYHDYNGGHLSAGGTDMQGAARIMKLGTQPGMGSTVSNITIPANGQPQTVYFQADDLLPYGYTTSIAIEVSNDNGATWATTGLKNCYFNRLNA